MASGTFYVETKRLGNSADNMNSYISGIQNSLKGLNDEIIALSANWKGMASASFMLTYHQDCKELEEIMTNMTTLCEQLKNAQGAYNRCERKVESAIAHI